MLGVLRVALPGAALARTLPRLVSLWTFDENGDPSRTFDDSGPADVTMDIIGAWTSTASLVRDVGGRSASKTGAAYGVLPAYEPAHDLKALTLSVYYQSRTAGLRQVILNRGDGDAPGDFSIERLANGRLGGWHVGQDAKLRFFGSSDGIAGADLINGTAYRIDLTLGPRGAHVYLDGRRLSAAMILGHVNGWNNAAPLYLGVRNDGTTDPVDGTVDHLRLWNDQLTDGEIALLEAADDIEIATQAKGGPLEPPLLADGLQGWISTTMGQFLFGDATTAARHGKSVHEARNLQDQMALFSQASAGPRPTWDTVTFDVPCIRSDGAQYLTRRTALEAPGLVIVGCAFDAGGTGFHALAGARSSATSAGNARGDAWNLGKAGNDHMRALTATSSGQFSADTPQILGEKLLVMLEIVGDELQVWQVGSAGEQTIVGTRSAAQGEQALFANYLDDAITAVMQGAIFEFAQYAPAPSRAVRRVLAKYFQALIWPAASPPVAAAIDAGQIQQGSKANVDVITPSSGSSLVLASIDEQPAVGSLAASGNDVVISVPPGAALGNYSGQYCLRSDIPGARLVDFGRIDFEVIAAAPGQDLLQ